MTDDDIRRALATEADLIAEGQRMITEAEATIATARQMIRMAEARKDALELLARVHGVEISLQKNTPGATNKHMPAAATKETEPRIGRPVTYTHPLALWVKNHGTAKALAEKLSKPSRYGGLGREVSVSTLRSWYLDPPHGRPCPEDAQELLEKGPYFIPRSAWKNRPSR